MSHTQNTTLNGLAENHFVRHRNVFLVQVEMDRVFRAARDHWSQHGIALDPEVETRFLRFLSVFALHAASRPKRQVLAWTINLQNPLLNLFFAADTDLDSVVGRVFTEHVQQGPQNRFYQECATQGHPVSRSICTFDSPDPLLVAENYYAQSEQRPARFFQTDVSRYVMLVAHPDCEEAWLRHLEQSDLVALADHETVVPIERRPIRWACGCTEQKLIEVVKPLYQQDPDDLFDGKSSLEAQCPRCAARYQLSRETVQAHLQANE